MSNMMIASSPLFCLRSLVAIVAVAAVLLPVVAQEPPPPPPPPPPALRTVVVTAEGYNHDDALKQALRKALEQGAGVEIAGYSQTQDYMLVRDTIYSRASGIVTEYRILSEEPGAGGTVVMKIEATVRPDAVAQAWGEVQNVLDQIGHPKIMVWIDERIDGRLQKDPIVESRIEELFVKAGFDLVTRKALGDLHIPEMADVRDDKGLTRLQQIAKEAGAHILIRGAANADRAGLENIYGVPAAFYNCDVQARIYYTDTGRLLASESVPVTRRGVRSRHEFSPQAAREALVQATFPAAENAAGRAALAVRLYESVMTQWSTIISAGGDIELDVKPLDFKSFLAVKRALAEVEGIKSVDGDFSSETGRFRIKATIAAQTLAELLTEKPFDAWLEVTDLKLNRIQARAVAKPASNPTP
ncbi:MAG: hypothetical protein PVJ57_01890 [Phycisphaerae bacterium]|jgi:copper chaperone CopZ